MQHPNVLECWRKWSCCKSLAHWLADAMFSTNHPLRHVIYQSVYAADKNMQQHLAILAGTLAIHPIALITAINSPLTKNSGRAGFLLLTLSYQYVSFLLLLLSAAVQSTKSQWPHLFFRETPALHPVNATSKSCTPLKGETETLTSFQPVGALHSLDLYRMSHHIIVPVECMSLVCSA